MTIFTDNGGSIYGKADNIWTQSSISGSGVGNNVFEGLGRTVEEDVLAMRAGGGRPSYPRATPGIPMALTGFGDESPLQEDVFRNPYKYLGTLGEPDETDEEKMKEWMQAAQDQTKRFEALKRLGRSVASILFRRDFNTWLDGAGTDLSPEARYNSVIGNLAGTAAYGSKPWMQYMEGRRINRIKKLERFNDHAEKWIGMAVKTAGTTTPQEPEPKPQLPPSSPPPQDPVPDPSIQAEAALKKAQDLRAAVEGVIETGKAVEDVTLFHDFYAAASMAEQLAVAQDKEAIRQKAAELKVLAIKFIDDLRAGREGEGPLDDDREEKKQENEEKDAFPTTYVLIGGAALAVGIFAALTLGKK